MNRHGPLHTHYIHTRTRNCISTVLVSNILIFLPIPAELELGGTAWGGFLKIQSSWEKPWITKQGISLPFFCTFLLQAPIFSLSTSLLTGHANWQAGGHEFHSSFLTLSLNIRATHVKRGKRPSAAVNPTLPIWLPIGSHPLLSTLPHADTKGEQPRLPSKCHPGKS